MKWSRGHTGAIEDRRSEGGSLGGFGMGGGGGGIPIPVGVGGGAGLLIFIAVVLLNLLAGGGGGSIGGGLDPLGGTAVGPAGTPDLTNNGDEVQFIGYIADDANQLWADTFQRAGQSYTPTKIVLFTGSTQSGCGTASSETGPFYCPLDQKVYLDLDFFKELRQRFKAPGDFAEAYVVAHEIGHHVQEQLGIEKQVRDQQQQDPSLENELSVKLELQADCLAGVWAQSVYQQGDLESGDIDEALNAASAVGDDRIQRSAGEAVNPETWTHGSAEQRSSWFKTGFQSGDPAKCDTLAGT